VAGYRAWQRLGRQVRRGERAIRIWAPHTRSERDPESGAEARRVSFVTVPVFESPRPRASRCRSLRGRLSRATRTPVSSRPLEAFAQTPGHRVDYLALAEGVQGLCDPTGMRILID
jgi:hypothetical protein